MVSSKADRSIERRSQESRKSIAAKMEKRGAARVGAVLRPEGAAQPAAVVRRNRP
jgi:hypothetical protein